MTTLSIPQESRKPRVYDKGLVLLPGYQNLHPLESGSCETADPMANPTQQGHHDMGLNFPSAGRAVGLHIGSAMLRNWGRSHPGCKLLHPEEKRASQKLQNTEITLTDMDMQGAEDAERTACAVACVCLLP